MGNELRLSIVALTAALGLVAPAKAAPQPPTPPDYSRDIDWICRPGRADACSHNLDATIITADGRTRIDRFRPDPAAPVDCLYLYGTASVDEGGNSDARPGQNDEISYVREQFPRLGGVCRLFAPVHRQSTITAMLKKAPPGDPALADADVSAALAHYLKHDNQGRPFVLIGHSQGANIFKRLIQREIDGKLIQARMLSAMLLGADVTVAKGQTTGGDFKSVPLCQSARQIGCVISFHAYRATVPESLGALSPAVPEGLEVACVNPAALLQSAANRLNPILPTSPRFAGTARPSQWTALQGGIATFLVSLPDMISAQCQTKGAVSYLAISLHTKPSDLRTQDIPGDSMTTGKLNPYWGLHSVEPGLVMGDLAQIIRLQGETFRTRGARP